jgi:hypothetical protein
MILYVNGDSHSLGAMKSGAVGDSFVDLIKQHFNCKVHNDAEPASSAQRIIRTTKNYIDELLSRDQLFILVGWGTWEREEWEYEGKFYNIMLHWYKHLPEALQQQYHDWASDLGSDSIDKKSQKTHEEIFQLHQSLQQHNIPHLFFNCMYNFFGIKEDQKKDWNNCYVGPYDNDCSYYWYLTKRGYTSDSWYHFGEDGHKAWANVLIKYIEENKIL